MVIATVEQPGGIHLVARIIGHLIVLAGAVAKGRSELTEMTNVGIRKYFSTTVRFLISNVH